MSKRSFILTVLFFIVVMAIAVIWTKSVRKEDGGYVTPRIEQHVFSEPTDESSLAAAMQEEVRLNSYSNLSVPTYLTKIADTYFIVDCYHDQVIYHDNLTEPLCQWSVMTDEIDKGHTLASDGIVYLIDDTENNRILVF